MPKKSRTDECFLDVTSYLDPVAQKVILMKTVGSAGMNATIDIARITEIHGDLVDYMDDGVV